MHCHLCHTEQKLCKSHIVPEFLYRDLYNGDHMMMGINGQGNKGWKPLQKGIREKLFCSDCEQHLNDKYEKPFLKQWLNEKPLPSQMSHNSLFSATYDYPTFKLFHLSILFRASVSSLSTFQEVDLGKHEKRINQMLLNEDPGQDWEYPILAFAVLNGNDVEKRLISQPIRGRHEGHRAYGQIYGGAMWWILVSSHRNDLFCRAGLQPSGKINISAELWDEIGVIQNISAALNPPASGKMSPHRTSAKKRT
jgi:hypothetical protein